jgi:hypothetical protein
MILLKSVCGYNLLSLLQGLPQTLVGIHANGTPNLGMLNAFERLIDWTEMNQFEGIQSNISGLLKSMCKKYGRGIFHDPIEVYFMDTLTALGYIQCRQKLN